MRDCDVHCGGLPQRPSMDEHVGRARLRVGLAKRRATLQLWPEKRPTAAFEQDVAEAVVEVNKCRDIAVLPAGDGVITLRVERDSAVEETHTAGFVEWQTEGRRFEGCPHFVRLKSQPRVRG